MARNAPGFSIPEKSYIGGRRVRGPGTPTSDSVPAALSKDEFVIKAKSARRIGYSALNHMNQTGDIPMRMAIAKSKSKKMPFRPGRMKLADGGVPEEEELTPIQRQFKGLVPGIGKPPAAPAPTPVVEEKLPMTPPPPMNDAIDISARKQKNQGVVPGMYESIKRRFFKRGGDAGLRKGYAGGGHPGFKAVQAKIAAKSGVPMKNAGAILAASSRGASAAAKRANPRLNRVK